MLCVCFYLGETNSKNKQVPNYSHRHTDKAEDKNKLKKHNITQLFCILYIIVSLLSRHATLETAARVTTIYSLLY